jgi:putative holliday junction resolvase
MGRIMAIDYGLKRVGIAVTDPLQMVSTPLITVEQPHLFDFLSRYLRDEAVDKVIIGYPVTYHQQGLTPMKTEVKALKNKISQLFPHVAIDFQDEQFSSREAQQAQIQMGMKKSMRKDKKNLDVMSAAIILQRYLEENG